VGKGYWSVELLFTRDSGVAKPRRKIGFCWHYSRLTTPGPTQVCSGFLLASVKG
jgi:hypothetical protein